MRWVLLMATWVTGCGVEERRAVTPGDAGGGDAAVLTVRLDVEVNGEGSVTGDGIDCPGDCQELVVQDTRLPLLATPTVKHRFAGWSGVRCTGYNDTIDLVVSHDIECSARFLPIEHNVHIEVSGSGRVTSAPAGIQCPHDCGQSFGPSAAAVELTPEPTLGSYFDGWGGDCTGNSSIMLPMDRDYVCTARFVLRELVVTLAGSGSGRVVSDLEQPWMGVIQCPNQCAATFAAAAETPLFALPAWGSRFAGWSGDCVGDEPETTVMVDGARACGARFELLDTATFELTVTGEASVHLYYPPYGDYCAGETCTLELPLGTVVKLDARDRRDTCARFAGWAGDIDSEQVVAGEYQAVVLLDGPKSLSATFESQPLADVAVAVVGAGAIVSSEPQGIDCPAGACALSVCQQFPLRLVAEPDVGMRFEAWRGDCTSSTPLESTLVAGPMSCTATFEPTAVASTWAATLGGPGLERGFDVVGHGEHGLAIAGMLQNVDVDDDAWVIGLGEDSSVSWQQQLGDVGVEEGFLAVVAHAGALVVAGFRESDGDVDLLAAKLDAEGGLLWQKSYGNAGFDELALAACPSPQGTAVLGLIKHTDGANLLVLELDGDGTVLWARIIDDAIAAAMEGDVQSADIAPVREGGYIVAATVVDERSVAMLVRLDEHGEVLWQRGYRREPPSYPTGAAAAKQTGDGGFVFVGWGPGNDNSAAMAVKVDAQGDIEWQRSYQTGFFGADRLYDIHEVEGGYIAVGVSGSGAGESAQAWWLRLNPNGEVIYSRAFGDPSYYESARAILPLADGSSVFVGETQTYGFYGSGVDADLWAIHVDESGAVAATCEATIGASMPVWEGPQQIAAVAIDPTPGQVTLSARTHNGALDNGASGTLWCTGP